MTRINQRPSCRHAATTCVILSLFGGVALCPPSAHAATINRNLDSYVLFALESLSFKGRNAMPSKGFILGGNVGVNIDSNNGSNGHDLTMGGGGSSHAVVMSAGTQVVADRMNLGGADVTVGDIFANTYSNETLNSIHASGPTAYTAPIIDPLTSFDILGFTPNRAITNNAADLVVNNGLTHNLALGDYRDIQVKDDATINFGPGTYNIRNLVGGKDITIGLTDATIILVDGEFTVNNDALIGAGTGGMAQIKAGSLGVGANDNTIKFSQESEARGQFFAPNGILSLGNNTDLFGRFIANVIGSDFNVNVTYIPGTGGGIPEPGTLLLAVFGFAAALSAARRRRS
ncbi:MAG: PEP-CTERM sorting domain-containing protein [Pirellulales bacterium]